jgi:glycogen debranching enzyme
MEGLGHAFAILFGIASPEQARAVLDNQYVAPYGIPCVWPVFPWFASPDGMTFGRHNGTVWPFIQGFWASAAAMHGRLDLFDKELTALADMADRHREFKEIYHPITGEPYGGLQVDRGKVRLWAGEPHQTWSATGYLRMIYYDLFGMRFQPDELCFQPTVPPRFETLQLTGVKYRDMTLDVTIRNSGTRIASFALDGQPHEPVIPATLDGQHRIVMNMR